MIWALVAGSAMFWSLRLGAQGPRAPEYTVPVAEAGLERADLSRLLGAPPVARAAAAPVAETSSRYKLVGVVAPRAGSQDKTGVALIAIDGKRPRAYRVGAHIDGDLVLHSVALRSALLGPSGAAPVLTLQMPLPAVAATGRLPAPSMSAPEGEGEPMPIGGVQGIPMQPGDVGGAPNLEGMPPPSGEEPAPPQ